MNKAFIIGRLTKDPEIRVSKTNKEYLNFSLAVNDNQTSETYYFNCVAFSNRANYIANYAKKGSKMAIEGKMQPRKYTSKETGLQNWTLEIIVDNVELLDSKRINDHVESFYEPKTTSLSTNKISAEIDENEDDDSIEWIDELNK